MQHDNFIPLDDFKPFYVPDELIRGKVISISSHDELNVGYIKGFSVHENSGSKLPIVEFEDGVEYLCFSMLIPYTERMYDLLEDLPKKERTDLVKNILHLHSELRRLERPDVLKDVK